MSTREQAILYWILILIFLSVVFGRKNVILDSLMNVVKYTFKFLINPISIVIISFNFFYLCLVYYFEYKENLEISLWYIKDYLIILFFSVYPIVAYLKKINFKQLFHEKKAELFSLAAIPLFINSSYTFSVVWEMILVFVLTILSILIAIGNQKEDTKMVAKFFNFFLITISLFMIFSSFSQFIKNINDVLTLNFWLSFGLEPLVWIINIPVIYLIREMVFIKKKIIFSEYKNRVYPYIKYCAKLLARKIKFRKYAQLNHDISNYIQEAKELSAIGGNRIYIKLNKKDLSNEILIAITIDAILGRNKFTNINNQREKYPNVVEIKNANNELCVFWQDNFVAPKYRVNEAQRGDTVELLEGIKLIRT
ncbi:hypothetical protein HCJ74_01235 [Listeria welshimeri]|nr:hypothetical protein [Listeria welshimeri]